MTTDGSKSRPIDGKTRRGRPSDNSVLPSASSAPADAPDLDPAVADGLVDGPVRGRGAGLNPKSRFDDLRLHVLGEHLDEQAREHPSGVQVRTQVFEDDTRAVLNRVDVPDIHFRWTVNPYRGCEHGCIYCYARPGHEYFGLSCGLDFETKVFAKPRAATLLRDALAKPSWEGEGIVMSGVTDPYQPIEPQLRITRACLEVLADCRQPVSLITKNKLITRDIDLLSELASHGAVHAAISITSLDNSFSSKLEPRASSPRERLEAVRALSQAGIPVSVMTAPIIPGLNDREIPAILEAAAEAGAQRAGWVMLRLPYQIKDLFLEWLKRHVPDRAAHVESLIRQVRGGNLYDADLHTRMRGTGAIADQIAQMHKVYCKRFGLDKEFTELNRNAFRRPAWSGDEKQMGLW